MCKREGAFLLYIQMDQSTTPLERILDLAQSDHNLFSLLNQENSYLLQPLSLFGCNETKNVQKNQFFAQSPNPFKGERKNSIQLAFEFKHQNILSQQNFYTKKFNFDEDQNMLKLLSTQRQSQFCCPQGSFSPKKRNFYQFSCKQGKESIYKENEQNQNKISKNDRGLKNLSERMHQTLKKQARTTFGQIATELIDEIKKKSHDEGKQMLQRDEKNIRRRSYDALNVLIAAGVIEKIEKFISLKKNEYHSDHSNPASLMLRKHLNLKLFIVQLQQRIQRKNQIIQRKRQEFKFLAQRKANIQRFFKHKMNYQHLNTNDRIKFPFLWIKTDTQNFKGLSQQTKFKLQSMWEKQNSSTCDEYQQKKCITLNFKSKDLFDGVKIEGDIDVAAIIGKSLGQYQKK